MIFNNTLFMQLYKGELRKRGIPTKGILMADYRNILSLDQQKQMHEAKLAAEKRTRELQNTFSGTLGIDENKQNADWIADAMRSNKKLGMVIRE